MTEASEQPQFREGDEVYDAARPYGLDRAVEPRTRIGARWDSENPSTFYDFNAQRVQVQAYPACSFQARVRTTRELRPKS
jgi:hypothetical protein